MTLRAGVIGWPIEQSKSPIIHAYWLDKFGIEGIYEKIALSPDGFQEGILDLISKGYRGANVTIPHKEAAFQICDTVSERALKIGAVNTLVFEDGKVTGDNTDGYGFLENIRSSLENWNTETGPAFVIGAGGAARGILWALEEAGYKDIRIWNRTVAKAEALAEVFSETTTPVSGDLSDAINGAAFLVNTSSLGMVGQPQLEINLTGLHPDAVVTDIVYNPLETDLLRQANSKGFETVDGLGMLLHQATPGFEKWFGQKPEVTPELRELVLK